MQPYLNKIALFRLLADLGVILLSFAVSICLTGYTMEYIKRKVFLALVLLVVWYLYAKSNRLYNDHRVRRGFSLEFYQTLKGVFILALTIVVFLYFFHYFLDNYFLLIFVSLAVALFGVEKLLADKFVRKLRKKGVNLRRVILMGFGETALQFHKLVVKSPQLGYEIMGYLDDSDVNPGVSYHLGKLSELERVLFSTHVNEVIVTFPGATIEDIDKITHIADKTGTRVRVVPDFYFYFYNRYELLQFGNIPTFSLRKEPLEETNFKFLKRSFDVVFSVGVLLCCCSWLFPIVAVLIKINSKGPVFFKQKRLGRDRKEFWCYKFRSMYVNDESDKLSAKRGDSRITSVGRFLRKTSLDEFPQFWNVLRGDMSVVGPRPHMSKQNEEYQKLINNYMVRQLIKPGITGWAQVNGFRGQIESELDIQNRVAYDIWYLENWSFFLDVKIIYLTVMNVFRGEEKAY